MIRAAARLHMQRRLEDAGGGGHDTRQPSLLASSEFLLDDPTGTIAYFPNLLSADTAADCFDTLRELAPWTHQRREMYGRTVDVPRLTAAFRLDDDSAPDVIRNIAAAVQSTVPAPFNSVGLNLYRDGNDSVAPHNDHLYEIAAHQPIALVSLGATRRMVIRAKQAPHRTLKLDLDAGSLLLMSYATQLHYDHGIPKLRAAVGPRISLAFRVRPQADRRYGGGREITRAR